MTDPHAWLPPDATPPDRGAPNPNTPPDDSPDVPRAHPPDPGSSPPSGYGPPPGGPHGWTPPPQPGLIPLRPLSFGTLLAAPFRMLRRNPKATFGSALILQGATAILTAAVVLPVSLWASGRIGSAAAEDLDAITAGSIGTLVLALLVPFALSLGATAFLQGIVVLDAARGTLGEKVSLGGLWRAAGRRLGPLVLWVLLVSVVVLVAIVALGTTVTLFAVGGGAGIAVAIVIGVIGVLGGLVLAAWLYTKLSLVPSVIVLERSGIRVAMRRSWRLTDGYFWRTFGSQFLVAVIVNVAAQLISAPLALVFGFLTILLDPTGSGAADNILIPVYIGSLALTVIVGAVASIAQAGVIALIYIDLRMRREGLDVELQRFVDTRDRGGEAPDPYLGSPVDDAYAGVGRPMPGDPTP